VPAGPKACRDTQLAWQRDDLPIKAAEGHTNWFGKSSFRGRRRGRRLLREWQLNSAHCTSGIRDQKNRQAVAEMSIVPCVNVAIASWVGRTAIGLFRRGVSGFTFRSSRITKMHPTNSS
jgi:hypothetical protein